MDYKKIFETIDELYEPYLDIWEDACNIESPSKYKEGVDAVGKYFSSIAEKKGWKIDTFYNDVSGNVVTITLNSSSDKKPLVISGHMDTVPGNTEQFLFDVAHSCDYFSLSPILKEFLNDNTKI